MRPGQQNKRLRGRNNNRKGPNPLTRSFESNGPDVKIRGTALHIAEKYVQLARDAQSSGDRVAGESYLQHAEHYYRIIAAAQAQMPQPQTFYRNDEGDDDEEDGEERPFASNDRSRPQGGSQPGFPGGEPQPYVNGNTGYAAPSSEMQDDDRGRDGQPQFNADDETGEAGGQHRDQANQSGEFQGLPPGEFRNRRRRSNRGRGRRPEGENRPGGSEENRTGDDTPQMPPRDQEFSPED